MEVYKIVGDDITANLSWSNNGNTEGWILGDYLFSATTDPTMEHMDFPVNVYDLYTADIVWQLDPSNAEYIDGFFGGLVDYGEDNVNFTVFVINNGKLSANSWWEINFS